MGGPLVVLPASAAHLWDGCTQGGLILGGTDGPDDYDRACKVPDYAGVIDLRNSDASALVLGEEAATTCYLPERRVFVYWLAADSDRELFDIADGCLDPEE